MDDEGSANVAQVMVVEDDPRMRELIGELLRTDGHDPVLAADGVSALGVALQGQMDAAVIDVMLPGMGGFELCRQLRRHESNIGIVLLTARDGLEDRVSGLDSGADDYLTKPFQGAELLARVRAVLRRQQRVPGAVTVGDLFLDPLTLRAQCGERPLTLSVKEFFVLRVLAVNAGRPVSRRVLLSEVWGAPDRFESSLVDQYVSYVRKKLGNVDAAVAISTVRGVGYRLDAIG